MALVEANLMHRVIQAVTLYVLYRTKCEGYVYNLVRIQINLLRYVHSHVHHVHQRSPPMYLS